MFSLATVQSIFGSGSSLETQIFAPRSRANPVINPDLAIKNADKNQERDIARAAKEPTAARDIANFKAAVAKAGSAEALAKDPKVLRVLLTASGLSDQTDALGLARRVLLSDLSDENSVANQMEAVDSRWTQFANDYKLKTTGFAFLKTAAGQEFVAQGYAKERWLASLEESTPGLPLALSFRDIAKGATDATDALAVLGNSVLREVVTVAYNIPREIALQSEQTQIRIVNKAFNVKNLQDPSFVDALARRYLTVLNGQLSAGSTGITV